MANSQEPSASQHPDLLAAVVLHTLVSEGHEGLDLAHVALACEREPSDPADMHEVEQALETLLDDGLAQRDGDLYRPMRAAVRASKLSF